MAEAILIPHLPWIIASGLVLGTIGLIGGLYLSWLKIRHGYPLENSWGKPIYPQKNEETVERIRLLSSENAQLRAELGAIKDRLANVERIVTDDAHRLTHEIECLRGKAN